MATKFDPGILPHEAAANPTVNNDSADTAGVGRRFHNGDLWKNTATSVYYLCIADTATAAVWDALISSSAYGVLPPVADLAALAALPTTGLVNGARVYVISSTGVYVLDTVGAYTPDGVVTVAGLNGGTWVAEAYGRWRDLVVSPTQGVANRSWTYEAFRNTPFYMYFSRHDQDDELDIVFQFPHSWITGGSYDFHVHWVPMADPLVDQDVYWSGQYAWAKPTGGSAIPVTASWTSFTKTATVSNGQVYIPKMTTMFTTTPPAGMVSSSLLFIYLKRFGTSGSDTYTTSKDHGTAAANVGLASLDVHYRVLNAAGSVAQTG